jgi:chromosome segregation ATPase
MTTWHAAIGLVLTAFSIVLGALYFTSTRRRLEMRELQDQLSAATDKLDKLQERVAVVEEARRNLDSQIKNLCETMDKKTDSIIVAQRCMMGDLDERFTAMLSEVNSTIKNLQNVIVGLRIKIGN